MVFLDREKMFDDLKKVQASHEDLLSKVKTLEKSIEDTKIKVRAAEDKVKVVEDERLVERCKDCHAKENR